LTERRDPVAQGLGEHVTVAARREAEIHANAYAAAIDIDRLHRTRLNEIRAQIRILVTPDCIFDLRLFHRCHQFPLRPDRT